jgi:hypothetical protein
MISSDVTVLRVIIPPGLIVPFDIGLVGKALRHHLQRLRVVVGQDEAAPQFQLLRISMYNGRFWKFTYY